MANLLKPSPPVPLLSERPSNGSPLKTQLSTRRVQWRRTRRRAVLCWGVGLDGNKSVAGQAQDRYLVREFGWGVRRMAQVDEEMKGVAQVQAEAFHVPVALFDDFFFQFFKAEVLSALIYRVKNSPSDRYACLVAESVNANNSQQASFQGLVGVTDVTVQRDEDILRQLEGADEYLYVSGIAVLTQFRRQKVATVMLKACDVLSVRWGFGYLALRAYEDDSAARKVYSNAGYKVVSGDPHWVTWIGRKRRVLMIKQSITQRTI